MLIVEFKNYITDFYIFDIVINKLYYDQKLDSVILSKINKN